MSESVLADWIVDWADELVEVPTRFLDECASKAMRGCLNGPVSVPLIIQAYKDLLLGQTGRSQSNVSNCKGCFGSGWQRVITRNNLTGHDTTAVKPCECENGRKYDKSYERAISRNN